MRMWQCRLNQRDLCNRPGKDGGGLEAVDDSVWGGLVRENREIGMKKRNGDDYVTYG